MKKSVKIILSIILICILLYVINVVRNIFILKDIQDKSSKLSELNDFSYTLNTDDLKHVLTKKGNIIKVEEYEDNKIMYFNTETDEAIEEDMETGEKTYYQLAPTGAYMPIYNSENTNIYKLAFKSIILSSKLDDKKCYKIINSNNTSFVEKEQALLLKTIDKDEITTNYTNYKLDNIDNIEFNKVRLY